MLRGKPIRPPGARGCKRYMRERLAAALPYLSDRLLSDACGGKIAALKLVVQISGLSDKGSDCMSPMFSGGRSYEDLLREEWQKEPVYVHPPVHPFPLEFRPPPNPNELVGPEEHEPRLGEAAADADPIPAPLAQPLAEAAQPGPSHS